MQTGNNLDRFHGLKCSYNACHDAEHSDFFATAFAVSLGGFGEYATIARSSAPQIVDTKLTVKLERSPRDERLSHKNSRVREEITGGEVVRAIQDDVVFREDVASIGGVEGAHMWYHFNERLKSFCSSLRRLCFRNSYCSIRMKDLSLKIRKLDNVVVDDSQCSWKRTQGPCISEITSQLNSPTPAAAKYWMAGQPRPPAPTTRTDAFFSFSCPFFAVTGQKNRGRLVAVQTW